VRRVRLARLARLAASSSPPRALCFHLRSAQPFAEILLRAER
jgi:hypothetical protein